MAELFGPGGSSCRAAGICVDIQMLSKAGPKYDEAVLSPNTRLRRRVADTMLAKRVSAAEAAGEPEGEAAESIFTSMTSGDGDAV